MRQITSVLVLIAAAAIFGGNSFGMNNYKKQAKVRAPELNGGKGWLNTDKPLSIAGLKGKVILLDFWTYGCINCIHIIPDLKKLEAKGLSYSKEADRLALMRRAYLDLIGLLPTKAQINTYLSDKSPDAYEKLVDQL